MTPAILALEQTQVSFKLHPYEHDSAAPAYGLEAADKLRVPPARIFKTLVARVDGARLVMALVPADQKLNLKALAAAVEGKKAAMCDPALAESTTGYVVGAITPLGGRKTLPVVVDQSAQGQRTFFISAGRRGLQVELAPQDLLRLTNGRLAAIAAG